jgi:hypothetical protein
MPEADKRKFWMDILERLNTRTKMFAWIWPLFREVAVNYGDHSFWNCHRMQLKKPNPLFIGTGTSRKVSQCSSISGLSPIAFKRNSNG